MQSKHFPGRELRVVAIALAVVTFAIFANSLRGEFTNWDDNTLVLENEAIRSLSPENVVAIFTPVRGKTYQPLRVLSYAANYAIAEFAPFGYHLLNTLLHVGAAVMLLLFVYALLPALQVKASAHERLLIAALVAGLFAFHPVNVEAVAWISSRKYGLLALFYFSALYLHLCALGAGDKRLHWQAGSWGAALLAALSSPFAVTLPGVILLLDYCRRNTLNPLPILKSRWATYLPYAVCFLAVVPLLLNVSHSEGVDEIAKPHFENPFVTCLTVTAGLADYARNLTLPLWLNNRYSNRIVLGMADARFIAGLVGLIAVITLVVCELRKGRKLPFFCAGWFLLTWSPVSNIIPISTVIADRYLYLPAVGIFLGLALTMHSWRSVRPAFPGIAATLLVACCVGTVARNQVWASSISLWEDCIAKSPANYLAHNSLGRALREKGEIDAAIASFREAIRVNPDYHLAHHGLADVLLNHKKLPDEALPHFEHYLEVKKDNGLAWMNVGTIYGHRGDYEKAAQYLDEAARADPESSIVRHNLGVLLTLTNKTEEALSHYRKAIELGAESPQVYADLATALGKLQRSAEALKVVSDGLLQYPDSTVLQAALTRLSK
jgi:tetratricopeptide (TPR) repeat protein